jgi:hypothetical protein
MAGRCEVPRPNACLRGMVVCGVACADLQQDIMNCGACGRVCAPRQSCVAGACNATPPVRIPQLPTGRSGDRVIVTADGIVCAFDAEHSNPAIAASVAPIRLDLARNAWIPLEGMRIQRTTSAYVAMPDGSILVIGGYLIGTSSRAVYKYHPVTLQWDTLAPLPEVGTLFVPSAFLGSDGKVYVFYSIESRPNPSAFLVYNPAVDTWSPQQIFSDQPSFRLSVRVGGGRFLFMGMLDLTTALSEEGSTIRTSGPMLLEQRYRTVPVLGSNNRVYLIGGISNTSGNTEIETLDSVHVLDALNVTAGFSAVAPLSQRLVHPGTAVLRDGRILVVGGLTYRGAVRTAITTVRTYSPNSNTWE